jgi:hypothetical protein
VILDGTLLRIDRVGIATGRDRPFCSGKHKAHDLNVQVIGDAIGRLVWISPPLPGAATTRAQPRTRHHRRAHRVRDSRRRRYRLPRRRTHGDLPQRRRRHDPDTGHYRRPSRNQKDVNAAHARRRGPGERVNAELKNWKVLRKIRSCPNRADQLIAAVQILMIANA